MYYVAKRDIAHQQNKELLMRVFLLAITALVASQTAVAGHHEEKASSSNASAEWQISAYSSAAPDFIGQFATIIGSGGAVLREGTNGWICQSGNPRPVPESGWSSAHGVHEWTWYAPLTSMCPAALVRSFLCSFRARVPGGGCLVGPLCVLSL